LIYAGNHLLFDLSAGLALFEGANVLHLRAAYFMENTLPQVAVIRMMGSVAGPVRPDLKLQRAKGVG
jgi:hypothetical protein